jgi:MFS family permease
MGLLAHRVRADYAVIFGIAMTSIGALLMCVVQPEWTYWAAAFPAVALNPLGAEAMFTVSNLVITSVFPARLQGLAGGVFNTIAQIGKSVGLATAAVVANTVTEHSRFEHKESPEALMEGYRAAFWFTFAGSVATIVLFTWGLRGIGKVGMKRE